MRFSTIPTVASLAPEAGLLGKDGQEAARVDQWIHLIEEVNDYTENIERLLDGVLRPYSKSVSPGLYFTYRTS